jgi:hypothetical protein
MRATVFRVFRSAFHKLRETRHQYRRVWTKTGWDQRKTSKKVHWPSIGGQTLKCTTFCARPSFIQVWPRLPLILKPPLLLDAFLLLLMYSYHNYLEPCALNARFYHFIPRFNQISFLCDLPRRGDGGGEQRPKDGMTLGKIPAFRRASVLVWVARASSTAPSGELHK